MAVFLFLWFALLASHGDFSTYWIVVALVWHIGTMLHRTNTKS